jgi:hypothetical protein
MAPKEKAEELVKKMRLGWLHTGSYFMGKQCALIAVDEIIELDVFDCNEDWSNEDGDTREYW